MVWAVVEDVGLLLLRCSWWEYRLVEGKDWFVRLCGHHALLWVLQSRQWLRGLPWWHGLAEASGPRRLTRPFE